jgi:TfoX/Sxy family transcriptional regulator of competence genes
MGRLDNFWLKSLPRSKHRNVADNKEINAENVFLSCDLTCDEIQIGGSSNVIRGNKRSYENRKQSGIEETRRGKKQKPVSLLYSLANNLRSDSSLNLIINENNSGVGQNYYY